MQAIVLTVWVYVETKLLFRVMQHLVFPAKQVVNGFSPLIFPDAIA